MAAAWEENEYVQNVPETESQKRKRLGRNMTSLALTSKTPFPMLPNVYGPAQKITEFLSGKKTTGRTQHPRNAAQGLRMKQFKSTLGPLLKRGQTTRRIRQQIEENRPRLEAEQRQREAASAERRQREQEEREREEFAEHLRRGTTLPTEGERKAASSARRSAARRKSRARRSKSTHTTRKVKRSKKSAKTSNKN